MAVISAASARAISGIFSGHRVAVQTWYEAATLYNSLWEQGLIIRVRF